MRVHAHVSHSNSKCMCVHVSVCCARFVCERLCVDDVCSCVFRATMFVVALCECDYLFQVCACGGLCSCSCVYVGVCVCVCVCVRLCVLFCVHISVFIFLRACLLQQASCARLVDY